MLERPDTAIGKIQSLCDSLDLTEEYEKYQPLGDTFRTTVHELHSTELSENIAQALNKNYYNNDETIHFITVRPSPEHIYNIFNRVPSYKEQLEWFARNINHPDILTVSVEKGNKHTQILHYHLIIQTDKKTYKKIYKKCVNCSTTLHKVYGYQKAVLESTKGHLLNGFRYFLGISKNIKNNLKPDFFKLIINKKLFKNKISI